MVNRPKIKKNDIVQVIVGKDSGKSGKVLMVDLKKRRVIVEKVNIVKRHQKQQQGKGGGIIEKEAPIHWSNVMIVNEKLGRPVRIKSKVNEQGKKIRVCATSGEALDQDAKSK